MTDRSFDEYMKVFAPDLTTARGKKRLNAGKEVKIKLT